MSLSGSNTIRKKEYKHFENCYRKKKIFVLEN